MLIKQLEQTAALIRKIRRETAKKGVRLLLLDVPYLEDGSPIKCSGFFSESPDKMLAVAVRRPLQDWLPILVHEYCHFLQWSEQSRVWRRSQIDSRDSSEIIDLYFSGTHVARETLEKAFRAIIAIELDCEKKSADLIRKMRLPIDVETYIQKANAYVCFYHEAKLRRSWCNPRKPPYAVESIWRAMPTDFESLDYLSDTVLDTLPSFSPTMPRGSKRQKEFQKRDTRPKKTASKSKRPPKSKRQSISKK